MAEVIVAPDVEAVVIAGLAAGLAARGNAAVVTSRIPSKHQDDTGSWIDGRPDTLVRVRRRGGPRSDVVLETALLLIECWAPDEPTASDLAGLTAGLLASLEGQTVAGHHITHAEILGGPSNDPDPATDSPRYTLTGQVTTFADPA